MISAILRKHSASEECGPETKVPLTLVEYRGPRQSDFGRDEAEILYLMLTVGPFDLGGNEYIGGHGGPSIREQRAELGAS